jgi:hypothetical protein
MEAQEIDQWPRGSGITAGSHNPEVTEGEVQGLREHLVELFAQRATEGTLRHLTELIGQGELIRLPHLALFGAVRPSTGAGSHQRYDDHTERDTAHQSHR